MGIQIPVDADADAEDLTPLSQNWSRILLIGPPNVGKRTILQSNHSSSYSSNFNSVLDISTALLMLLLSLSFLYHVSTTVDIICSCSFSFTLCIKRCPWFYVFFFSRLNGFHLQIIFWKKKNIHFFHPIMLGLVN